MKLQKNKLKKLFKSGTVNYGIWNGLVDTYVAEICAGAGFDWVLIDGEHAPFDFRSMVIQMQVMARHQASIIVRPPVGDPILIKQLLDAGAQSFLIPMVDTAAQAEEMVAAMRYPPKGNRGVGTALTRAAQWDRTSDYLSKADKELCLIVQVETRLGMENIEAIANVNGVDAVFIGPSDLAASMGYLGQSNHRKVKEEVIRGFKLIEKCGKVSGTLVLDKKLADEYLRAGVKMLGVGADSNLLVKATTALANSFFKNKVGT